MIKLKSFRKVISVIVLDCKAQRKMLWKQSRGINRKALSSAAKLPSQPLQIYAPHSSNANQRFSFPTSIPYIYWNHLGIFNPFFRKQKGPERKQTKDPGPAKLGSSEWDQPFRVLLHSEPQAGLIFSPILMNGNHLEFRFTRPASMLPIAVQWIRYHLTANCGRSLYPVWIRYLSNCTPIKLLSEKHV